jgi:hypothetical protein
MIQARRRIEQGHDRRQLEQMQPGYRDWVLVHFSLSLVQVSVAVSGN